MMATTAATGTRRRSRKCRYASMYRFGSTCPPVWLTRPGRRRRARARRRRRRSPRARPAPARRARNHFGPTPWPRLSCRVQVRPPSAAQIDRADLAHGDAHVARRLRRHTGSDSRTPEPNPTCSSARISVDAVLHLPGLPAVRRCAGSARRCPPPSRAARRRSRRRRASSRRRSPAWSRCARRRWWSAPCRSRRRSSRACASTIETSLRIDVVGQRVVSPSVCPPSLVTRIAPQSPTATPCWASAKSTAEEVLVDAGRSAASQVVAAVVGVQDRRPSGPTAQPVSASTKSTS